MPAVRRVGGTPNDRGEWVFSFGDLKAPQPHGPPSSVDFPVFRGPPRHQAVNSV
jgi:hypothetical protein